MLVAACECLIGILCAESGRLWSCAVQLIVLSPAHFWLPFSMGQKAVWCSKSKTLALWITSTLANQLIGKCIHHQHRWSKSLLSNSRNIDVKLQFCMCQIHWRKPQNRPKCLEILLHQSFGNCNFPYRSSRLVQYILEVGTVMSPWVLKPYSTRDSTI